MPEAKTYRAAIVGLTGIGTGKPTTTQRLPVLGTEWPHSHAAAYAALPRTTVVAGCDLKPELRAQFEATFQRVWPDLRTYGDYREMLEHEHIDLLSVVTSDDRHAQIVVDAAERGIPAIFCEKPLATTIADCDRMIDVCERHGTALIVDHSRRFRPHWNGARALVGDGPLGPVHRIVGSWGGARAMLFRNGGHLVDTICWFAAAEPEWVVGALDAEHRDHPPRYVGQGGRDPSLDPGGTGLVQFQNGVRAFINCSKGMAGGGVELDVFCERGHLRVDDASVEVVADGGNGLGRSYTPIRAPIAALGETPAAIAELIAAVEAGRPPWYTPREAKLTTGILLAMLQSNATGHAAVHFPIKDV